MLRKNRTSSWHVKRYYISLLILVAICVWENIKLSLIILGTPSVADKDKQLVNQLTPEKQTANVTNLFWIHIQKTGTSLFNTLYLHFCPKIVIDDPDIVDKEKLFDTVLLKNYPPQEFCNLTIANMPSPGYHHPYPNSALKEFHYFTMFRDPIERLRSAFSFRPSGVPHQSLLKGDNISISFDAYINESHIPNCQLKMVLGYPCGRSYVDPSLLNVTLAIERIHQPNFYFGITDRWEESICLFHSKFGGSVRSFELNNNRKTKRIDTSDTHNYSSAETPFYQEVLKVFNNRVHEAGCDKVGT